MKIKKILTHIMAHKLIYLGLAIHLLFYISAFHTKWFDYFFSRNALHTCCLGMDFFQVPVGAYAFFYGGNISGTIPQGVAPYVTTNTTYNPNVYHPLFTLIIGSLLMKFKALTAFYLWMFIKLCLTLWVIYYLYKNFKEYEYTDLAIFFFLINSTQYLEIRISQYHFIINFFLLLMLINISKNKNKALNGLFYFFTLITKPIGLLWIPILTLKKQFKTLLTGLILFGIFTIIFKLNHIGDYYIWNITTHFFHPYKDGPIQIFTLTALLRETTRLPDHIYLYIKITSLAILFLLTAFKRITLLKGIFLFIVYYLLFYDLVYEYSYTTLIPILTICIIMYKEFQNKISLFLITLIHLPPVFVLLHFFNTNIDNDPIYPNPTPLGWQLMVLNKIIPPVLLLLVVLIPDLKFILKDIREFNSKKFHRGNRNT